ncbi:hypothetical protein ABZP36_027995 [Zizania latifolia]
MDNTWEQEASDAHELDTLSLFGVADGTETIDEAAADHDDGGSDSSCQRSASSRYKPAKRHTAEQIRHLEAVFMRCTHPDEKSTFLPSWNLKKMQVHSERRDGMELQLENERLNAENKAMREAILDKICFRCGGPVVPAAVAKDTPEQRRLRSENAKLADELLHATAVLAQVTQNEGPQYGGAFAVDGLGAGLLVDPPTPMPSVSRAAGAVRPLAAPLARRQLAAAVDRGCPTCYSCRRCLPEASSKELLEPVQEELAAANQELLLARKEIVQVMEELVAAKVQGAGSEEW